MGDQAVPAGQNRGFPKGITPMLRLQALLPDRYTLAPAEEIDEWIEHGRGESEASEAIGSPPPAKLSAARRDSQGFHPLL